MQVKSSVLNIPSYLDFCQILAQFIHDSYGQATHVRILLPNVESSQTFLKIWNQFGATQPYIYLLGNLRSLYMQESIAFEYPAPTTTVYRTLFFTEYLWKKSGLQPPAALRTAYQLISFQDHLFFEDIALGPTDFKKLFAEDIAFDAGHTELIKNTLPNILTAWRKHLNKINQSDPTLYDVLCMKSLAKRWLKHPPSYPVILAGTLAGHNCVLDLIKSVISFGYYIMPGLDRHMPTDVFLNTLHTPIHPQYNLHRILLHIQQRRKDVIDYPSTNNLNTKHNHQCLPSKTLSGSSTHDTFLRHTAIQYAFYSKQYLPQVLDQTIDLYDIPEHWHYLIESTEEKEAEAIAIIAKKILSLGKSVMVVTPHTILQNFIATHLQQLSVDVHPTIAIPLTKHPLVSLILSFVNLIFNPKSLTFHIALLSEPLFDMENILPKDDKKYLIHQLILHNSYASNIINLKDDKQLEPTIHVYLNAITTHITQYLPSDADKNESHTQLYSLKTLVGIITHALETFTQPQQNTLWLEETLDNLSCFPSLPLSHSTAIPFFHEWFSNINTYAHHPHPQIKIVNSLNARLLKADCVILAGLNEGIWPKDEDYNPWVSKQLIKSIGLTYQEKQQGLAAHDFIELLYSKDVWFTRSSFTRQGGTKTPTIMSRWLRRLDMILHANKSSLNHLQESWPNDIMQRRYNTLPYQHIIPSPIPPAGQLKTTLYITTFEQLQKNPYAFFVNHILRLRPYAFFLTRINQSPKIIGTLVHQILEETVSINKSLEQQQTFIKKRLQFFLPTHVIRHNEWLMYIKHKIKYTLDNYITWEQQNINPDSLFFKPFRIKHHLEKTGYFTKNGLTIAAKADRIDETSQGCILLDYKTGKQAPKLTDITNHLYLQLPVEAAMLIHSGFNNIPTNLCSIGILQLSASNATYYPYYPTKLTQEDFSECLEFVHNRFVNMHSPHMSYPFKKARMDDYYTHFARIPTIIFDMDEV